LDCICTQNAIPPQYDLQRCRCSTSSAESVLHTDMHTDGAHGRYTHTPADTQPNNPCTPSPARSGVAVLRDPLPVAVGNTFPPRYRVSNGVLNLLDRRHAKTAVFSQLSVSARGEQRVTVLQWVLAYEL
jgi:hypothetical protein